MKNKTGLFKYIHAAALIPVKLKCIRETQKLYFQSWHGLTVQLGNKYLPNIVATEKGYIDQVRKKSVNKYHR